MPYAGTLGHQGVTPPYAAPIEIAGGAIVTDEWGNARGGVRSPYVDIPTARYVPAHYLRNLIGIELPFSRETLDRLYGSRAEYLARFDAGMDTAVSAGWLLSADGERLQHEEAATAPF